MSNSSINYNSYWVEIQSSVKQLFDDIFWCERIDSERDLEEQVRDHFVNYMNANLDDHQWIFYTDYHFDVLRHSEHRNSAFDLGCVHGEFESLEQLTSVVVYWAMHDDMYDYFDRNVSEWCMKFLKEQNDELTWRAERDQE